MRHEEAAFAIQNLPGLQTTFFLASQVARLLGRGSLLLRALSP